MEHTPNPEVIKENIVPYGSRRLKNNNIPNLHYANKAKLMLKNLNNNIRIKS